MKTIRDLPNQQCFFLFLDAEERIKEGSEALLGLGGYLPEDTIGKSIQSIIPTFNAESPVQTMSTMDGKAIYLSSYRETWLHGAFALFPCSQVEQDVEQLLSSGENILLKMNSHSAIHGFAHPDTLSIGHFEQFFSTYYDLLVRFSGDHNSFSWNIPQDFTVSCPSDTFLGLLAIFQSYRKFLGVGMSRLHVNVIPYSSKGVRGFKLVASQPAMKWSSDFRLGIANYYLWLQVMQLGFVKLDFKFGTNGQDEFHFLYMDQKNERCCPSMLIGQRETWYSDVSLWMLRLFKMRGIRFIDSAEGFVQSALYSDPTHAILILDFGSFSIEETKAAFRALKEHKSLSIVGSATHISWVPSHWRGPVYIQKSSLAGNLDRLFSFFSKTEKSLNIQISRL